MGFIYGIKTTYLRTCCENIPSNILITLHSLGTYQNERKQNTAPLVLGSMTSPATYQTELKVPCTYQNSRTMYQNERKQNLTRLILGSMTSLAKYQTEYMV